MRTNLKKQDFHFFLSNDSAVYLGKQTFYLLVSHKLCVFWKTNQPTTEKNNNKTKSKQIEWFVSSIEKRFITLSKFEQNPVFSVLEFPNSLNQNQTLIDWIFSFPNL